MIALIGGDGSIGRRYQAVLNHLTIPFRVIEVGDSKDLLDGCNKAIIATPTDRHMDWAWECFYKNIPFLCEKPMSKNKQEIKSLMDRGATGYVVNNWSFISTNYGNHKPNSIYYDFYNTGKDGLVWDVCQLVLIADMSDCKISVRTNSYWWHAEWGLEDIPYNFIEHSYMQMIRAFDRGDFQRLWGLNKAYRMTELCEGLDKALSEGGECEGFDWNPSQEFVEKIARQDIRENRTEESTEMGL